MLGYCQSGPCRIIAGPDILLSFVKKLAHDEIAWYYYAGLKVLHCHTVHGLLAMLPQVIDAQILSEWTM